MILNLLTRQKPEIAKTLKDLKEMEYSENYARIHSLILKLNDFNPSKLEPDIALMKYKAIISEGSECFNSENPISDMRDFIRIDSSFDNITKEKYLSKLSLLEDYDFGIQCWNISMFIINDMIENNDEKQMLINDIKTNPEKYKAGLANFEEGYSSWEKLKEKIGFIEKIVNEDKSNKREFHDEENNSIIDALTKTNLNFAEDEESNQFDNNYENLEYKDKLVNNKKIISKKNKIHETKEKNNDILINNFKTAIDYRNKIDDIAGYIAIRENDSMESNKDYSKFVIPLNRFIMEDGKKIINNYQKYKNILGNISKSEIENLMNISKEDIDKHEIGFIDSSKTNTYENFKKMYKNIREKEIA